MASSRTIVFILLASLMAACSQRQIEETATGTAWVVTLVIAIPVAIVMSPVILTEILTGERDSKIKKVEVNDENFLELSNGESKANENGLIGEPTNIYKCSKPEYEIWEYDQFSLDSAKYIVFGDNDSIDYFSSTWNVSDTCHRVTG